MKFKVIFIVFFLCSFIQKSFSSEKDSLVQQIFVLIYNQKFDEAEKALGKYRLEIDPFYANILNLDLYWWKYSMSRSSEDAGNLKKVLNDLDKNDSNSVEERMNKLIKSSYQFRYEIKRYNFIGAMILRPEIRKEIEKIKSDEIQIDENRQKLFNLYLALFRYSDNSINPFLNQSKKEACEESLLEIRKYTDEDDLIVQTLAHYFLGRIYMKIENEPEKAKEQFAVLAKQYPENEYFLRLANNLDESQSHSSE